MDILLVLVVLFIAGVYIYLSYKETKRYKRRDEHIKSGAKTPGWVLSVQSQTQHERLRYRKKLIAVKLQLEDGSPEIIKYISRFTPDLPASIAGAVGIISVGRKGFGLIAERHQQMKIYAKKLEQDGKSREEIKEVLAGIALKIASGTPGGLGGNCDKDGFLIFPEPIPVDVYLTDDRKQIIVFDPAKEKEKFNKNYFPE